MKKSKFRNFIFLAILIFEFSVLYLHPEVRKNVFHPIVFEEDWFKIRHSFQNILIKLDVKVAVTLY